MKNIYLCGYSLYQLLLCFYIYAFFGWITEVIFHTLKTGKFINRGFLNGPVCPIYGCGVTVILLALAPTGGNVAAVFLISAALTTALEFITGFVLEKFFHKKWWDYSKEPFNVKGYICLRFSVIWGLACTFVFMIIQPLIIRFINWLPDLAGYVSIGLFTASLITDLVFTVLQILKLNERFKLIEKLNAEMRKSSDRIGEAVSDITENTVKRLERIKAAVKKSRLAKAFPSLKNHADKKDERENSDCGTHGNFSAEQQDLEPQKDEDDTKQQ